MWVSSGAIDWDVVAKINLWNKTRMLGVLSALVVNYVKKSTGYIIEVEVNKLIPEYPNSFLLSL